MITTKDTAVQWLLQVASKMQNTEEEHLSTEDWWILEEDLTSVRNYVRGRAKQAEKQEGGK